MEPEVSLQHTQVAPPVPILSQLDPVHAPTSHFLKTHLHLGLQSELYPSVIQTKTLYAHLLSPHTRYTPRPSHSSRFDHPNNMG